MISALRVILCHEKQEQSEPNVLVAYSVFGICHLRFICDLVLGIWNFMFYSIWVAGEASFGPL
jgi:hypothetical protein